MSHQPWIPPLRLRSGSGFRLRARPFDFAQGHARKAAQLWSGRRESNPRPTAWKAVTLPLSYSRQTQAAQEVPRLRSGFRRRAQTPASRLNLEGCDSTTELLPPLLCFQIPRVARDFACGLPLRSRPQTGSSYSRLTLRRPYGTSPFFSRPTQHSAALRAGLS